MTTRSFYERAYRRCVFPVVSGRLLGRRTARYLVDAEAAQWWSEEHLAEHQLRAIVDICQHAQDSCSWYRAQAEQLGLDARTIDGLDDFRRWPVLNRETVVTAAAMMYSDHRGPVIRSATGGSTGVPMAYRFDRDSAQRRAATTYRGYGWANAGLGAKTLWIWGTDLQPPGWRRRVRDGLINLLKRQHTVSCFALDAETMADYYAQLQRYRPQIIHAYTNPLYEFARFLLENSLTPPPPRSILVGAERLHGFQREVIESAFQAPVFETYGSREFLLIGAECDRHEGLHISADTLFVEVLDDNGQPTRHGDEGHVVITDFTNRAMPLIRFANGDRAIAGSSRCSCGRSLPLLTGVRGRVLDVIQLPDGRRLPGEFFPHLMKDYPGIRRFQVRQIDEQTIRIQLVTDPPLAESTFDELQRRTRERTGSRVEIEWDRVDSIPLTSTGKHQVVVGLDPGHRSVTEQMGGGQPVIVPTPGNRPQRLLLVIDTLEVGGTERSLLDLCRNLDRSLYEPLVCRLYRGAALQPAFERAGIPVVSFDLTGKYRFARAFGHLRRLVRQQHPDLIHTMLFRADQVGRAVGRWHRIPVISSMVGVPHESVRFDSNPQLSRRKHAAIKWLDRLSSGWVTHFHSVSRSARDSNCHHLGIALDSVTVVPRGREDHGGLKTPSADLLSDLGLTAEHRVLVNVGRLIPQKGQRDLVEAMPRVIQSQPATRLLIVGEGHLRDELATQITQLGLSDHVTLLGQRHDVPLLLGLADLFVFPSLYEGLPGAIVEAMLSATPIVSTAIPSIGEAVQHQRSAVLVPPQSPPDLANAIIELLGDPDRAAQLAHTARQDALRQFNIPTVTRQIEQLYDTVLAQLAP